MSNGIRKRENEEESIRKLAAQRQLYNISEIFDDLNLVFSVILPFMFSFALLLQPSFDLIKTFSYILSLIMIFVSLLLSSEVKSKKSRAACIQQDFDLYVFQMPWDNKLFGKRKNTTSDVVDYSSRIMNNPKQKNKLLDWYTPVVDSTDLYTGIFACQKENYHWDVGLRKRYRRLSTACILIFSFVVIGLGIARNETISVLTSRLIFIAPMLRWLMTLCSQLNNDISRLNELNMEFDNVNSNSMEDLQFIQKSIFENRKMSVKIPNLIYYMFKNNDEDKEHTYAQINVTK